MNSGQSFVFNSVMDALKNEDTSPLRLYCSGTAGTGKTFLTDCLADAIELKYGEKTARSSRPAVLLGAPTGLSAVLIRGQTLHSLFGISVKNGVEASYEALENKDRDMRRTLFSNVRLIIIDEISMVGSVMLAKIHNRLVEIKGCNEEFGGCHILVFGDLLQLPPVKAAHVFKGISAYNVRKYFGGCGSVNLWTHFQFYELTENMRQRDDLKYAELLGRMRVINLTLEDRKNLETRVLLKSGESASRIKEAVKKFIEIAEYDPLVMGLFPKLEEVEMFNKEVMFSYGLEPTMIECVDKRQKGDDRFKDGRRRK